MKSTNRIKKGQIEDGEKLDKIDQLAIDNDVVHKEGEETIRDTKTFKTPPKSEKDATSSEQLVRKSQLDTELEDKAEDNDVVHKEGDETIRGTKNFIKSPTSQQAAVEDDELVRKKESDEKFNLKVDKEKNKGLTDNNFSNEDKDKLRDIESNAQVNSVNSVNSKKGDVNINAKDISEAPNRKWAAETGADVTINNTSADAKKLNGKDPSFYAKDTEVLHTSDKGIKGGVATLNSSGKVPSAQLPESPSAVVTKTTINNFPSTGEEDTIYIASDTGLQYVWDGSGYTQTSTNLSLGETSITAYRGDRGKSAYDHSRKKSGNPHGVTKSDIDLNNVTNDKQLKRKSNLSDIPDKEAAKDNLGLGTAASKNSEYFAKPSAINNGKTIFKQNGQKIDQISSNQSEEKTIDFKDTTYEAATTLKSGLLSKEDKVKLDKIEKKAQKNVQVDWLQLDDELDSFIKNKESYLPITDLFLWNKGGSQKFDLTQEMHRVISVEVNGQGLGLPQYNKWYNSIEVLDTLDDGDQVGVTYMSPTDYSRIHGFKIEMDASAPEVTKIGSADMLNRLPIQNGMKGCLLLDNGKINYWLDENDWSKKQNQDLSDLTGADGQVMVRIPRHWRLDRTKNRVRTILFSDKPIQGAKEIPEMYVSAYKASLFRPDNILSSVVNDSTDYRGGNNQSAWDSENEFKSQKKKPVTAKSRVNFRSYAKKRGKNWYDMDIIARETIAWLITLEYGTRDHQAAIASGPLGVDSQKWNDFNSRYPLFQCGLTNDLGNNTGVKIIDLSDYDLGIDEVEAFRYRGIENFWGDIFEWTNGVNIIDNSYFLTEGKLISNSNANGYQNIGDIPMINNYITEMYPGTILPKDTNGGNSSTYYADRFYGIDSESIRVLAFGGPAYNGAAAGSFVVYSNIAPPRIRLRITAPAFAFLYGNRKRYTGKK